MKTIWKDLKGKHIQYKTVTPRILGDEAANFLCERYSDIGYCELMVAAKANTTKVDYKNIECTITRYDVSNVPWLPTHPKVKYLKHFLFEKEDSTDLLEGEVILAFEMQNNPTLEDMNDIIKTFLDGTRTSFVVLYDRATIGTWYYLMGINTDGTYKFQCTDEFKQIRDTIRKSKNKKVMIPC